MSLADKITTIARLNWVREKDVKEFIKRIKARIILPRYRKIIDEEAGEGLL